MILDKASQSFNCIWGPHPSHSLLYFHFQPLLVPHVSTSQPNGVLIWVIFLITFPNDAVFVSKSNNSKTHPSPRMPSSFLSSHQIRSDRGVHGSDWVRLRRFFDLTHPGGSKKIQPNPTQPTWVGLGWVEPMGLTIFYLLLNWVEKNININILKKT